MHYLNIIFLSFFITFLCPASQSEEEEKKTFKTMVDGSSEAEMELKSSQEQTSALSCEIATRSPKSKKRKAIDNGESLKSDNSSLMAIDNTTFMREKDYYLIKALNSFRWAARYFQEGKELLKDLSDVEDVNVKVLLQSLDNISVELFNEPKISQVIAAIEERNFPSLLKNPHEEERADSSKQDILEAFELELPLEIIDYILYMGGNYNEIDGALSPKRAYPDLFHGEEKKNILEATKETIREIFKYKHDFKYKCKNTALYALIFDRLNKKNGYDQWYDINESPPTDHSFEIYFYNRVIDLSLKLVTMYNQYNEQKEKEEFSCSRKELIDLLEKLSLRVRKETVVFDFLKGHILKLEGSYLPDEHNPHFLSLNDLHIKHITEPKHSSLKACEMYSMLALMNLREGDNLESLFKNAFKFHTSEKRYSAWYNQAIFMWIEKAIMPSQPKGTYLPDTPREVIDSMPEKLLQMYANGNIEPLEIYMQLAFLLHEPHGDPTQHTLYILLKLIKDREESMQITEDKRKDLKDLSEDNLSYGRLLFRLPENDENAKSIIKAADRIISKPNILMAVYLKCLEKKILALIQQRQIKSVVSSREVYREAMQNVYELKPYIGKYIDISNRVEFEELTMIALNKLGSIG
ncbi:hypothetical protein IM40_10185 (plasmid) [Candidatus Paracaedimonas acanthamoebae]|nr:hypothetical protein IM40_10185 [Candidatus Paracaedimonas acanthamoebae]